MTGRIRHFRPSARVGILQTDSGIELLFTVSKDLTDLHGGDIVEFESGQDGRPVVTDVTLRYRWTEMLNEQHRPLVNQFHNTIKIVS
ncbi:MAG: hypothetical protein ACYTF1_23480 [Planctomycetota bacterium]|jgi:hypothetical protein